MGALQVKNVPEELHDALRQRAANEQQSVSDYVLSLIRRDLDVPSQREWFERIQKRGPLVSGETNTADTLHELRQEREEELSRRVHRR